MQHYRVKAIIGTSLIFVCAPLLINYAYAQDALAPRTQVSMDPKIKAERVWMWSSPETILEEYHKVPKAVRNDRRFWLVGMAGHPSLVLDDYYDEVPEAVRNDKEFWLEGMRSAPGAVLGNYDKVPEAVRNDKDFWLVGMSYSNLWTVLKHYPKVPAAVRNDKDFWLVGMRKDPGCVLHYYDKIPKAISNDKEFWLEGMRGSPVHGLSNVLHNYDKIPKEISNDKEFWIEGMRHSLGAVLENYAKVPEAVRNDKEFWLVGMRSWPPWVLANYDLIPKAISNDKEFWIEGMRHSLGAVLENYAKVPEAVRNDKDFWLEWMRHRPRGMFYGHYDGVPETVRNDIVKDDTYFSERFQLVSSVLNVFNSDEPPSPRRLVTVIGSIREAMRDLKVSGTEGRTIGIEIEVDNNEDWEHWFGPTNNNNKLGYFLSQLSELMKEATEGWDVFDRSYYWNMHWERYVMSGQ